MPSPCLPVTPRLLAAITAVGTSILLVACGGDRAPIAAASAAATSAAVTFDSAHVLSAVSEVGAAPILALAPDGRYATAWVSAPDGGTDGRLHVLVTRDGALSASGNQATLTDPLGPIEPHGEAPPKLAWVTRPDGGTTLGALYVVGKLVPGRRFPASALRFVRSDDGGVTWSAPVTVTDDTTRGLDAHFGSHNFHALHGAPDGTFHVAWLDGRAGKSAVYTTHSTDGGATWARNVRVVPIGAPLTEACPCCRTAIAADVDGRVYLAWRAVIATAAANVEGGRRQEAGGQERDAHHGHAGTTTVRDIVVARSDDRGMTWSAPVRVHADDWVFDGCPHAGPSLAVDSTGTLHAAWWTGKSGAAGVFYAQSRDHATSFTPATPLGVAAASQPAHVQLAVRGRSVFATWDDGTKRVPQVVLRMSTDGGATFGAAAPASDPTRAATFPVLAVAPDAASLLIAWSEQAPEAASAAAKARPNMKDPKAVMPLPRVGNTQVLLRRGQVGAASATSGEAGNTFRPLQVGDLAPAYRARIVSGAGAMTDLSVPTPDSLTLLNVWATWCTSCREEMADLDALYAEYAPRGLKVVGVSVDRGDPQKVVRFTEAERLRFSIAHDPEGLVQRRFSVVGVPETYLIDGTGRIVWKTAGNIHGALGVVREQIERRLPRR